MERVGAKSKGTLEVEGGGGNRIGERGTGRLAESGGGGGGGGGFGAGPGPERPSR